MYISSHFALNFILRTAYTNNPFETLQNHKTVLYPFWVEKIIADRRRMKWKWFHEIYLPIEYKYPLKRSDNNHNPTNEHNNSFRSSKIQTDDFSFISFFIYPIDLWFWFCLHLSLTISAWTTSLYLFLILSKSPLNHDFRHFGSFVCISNQTDA